MNIFKFLTNLYQLIDSTSFALLKLILFFFILSLFDLLGIGLVIPFISVIGGGESEGLALNNYINRFIAEDIDISVLLMASLLIFVFFIKGILGYYVQKIIMSFSFNQQLLLRRKILHAYQQTSYIGMLNKNSSEVINMVTNHTNIFLSQALISTLRFFSELITVIILLLFLGFVNFYVTIVLLTVMTVSFLLYDKLVKNTRKSLLNHKSRMNV